MKFDPLNVSQMQLSGVHLIEASAGTGKTHNITRIIARLLLETDKTIDQILVVTFTKAATQELRSRVASFLLELQDIMADVLAHQTYPSEPILENVFKGLSGDELVAQAKHGLFKLNQAIVLLDEAPIYTINAFCQRELARCAFASALPFEINIENSTTDIVLQCVEDSYRKHRHSSDFQALVARHGVTSPKDFCNTFNDALFTDFKVIPTDVSIYEEDCLLEVQRLANLPVAQKIVRETQRYLPEIKQFNNFKPGGALDKNIEAVLGWIEAPTISVDKLTSAKQYLGKNTLDKLNLDKQTRNELEDLVNEYADVVVGSYKKLKTHFAAFKAHPDDFVWLAKMIEEIKAEAEFVKQRQNKMDHNDTVRAFANAINHNQHGLVDDLRSRYKVALIDEFQDTDQHQYQIFSALYPPKTSNMLLMIGDPKQAIYSFRGGDIYTYLQAVERADYRWNMQHNFRSTPELIHAYNLLFYGTSLQQNTSSTILDNLDQADWERDVKTGELVEPTRLVSQNQNIQQNLFGTGIGYPWIYAGKKQNKGLLDGSVPITFFAPQRPYFERDSSQNKYKVQAAKWVTNEIIRLLDKPLLMGTDNADTETNQNVKPQDIAILVRGKSEANTLQNTLSQAGIKSVYLSNKQSVFASAEAKQLLFVLEGMIEYSQTRKVLQACSTELLGLDSSVIAQLQDPLDPRYDEQVTRLVELSHVWHKSGIYSLVTSLVKEHFVSRKGAMQTERQITNYLHLADILQQKQKEITEHSNLCTWLARQIDMVGEKFQNISDEQIQRLESDDDLIKIVTIHGSKGLEYPIVFAPYVGYKPKGDSSVALKYQPDVSKQTALGFDSDIAQGQFVQVGAPPFASDRAKQQAFEESMRLLYVAITRAEKKCYLGIGKPSDLIATPIATCLGVQHANKTDLADKFNRIQQYHPDAFQFTYYDLEADLSTYYPQSNLKKSDVSHLQSPQRTEMQWEVQSFSKLTKRHTFVDMLEKESEQDNDSHQYPQPKTNDPVRFSAPRSATTGNLLHNILEDQDFGSDLDLSLHQKHLDEFFGVYPHLSQTFDVSNWLTEVLVTPIDVIERAEGSASSFTLSQLSMVRKEPEFYYPVEDLRIEDLAKLLGLHRSLELKQNLSQTKITGMLHGFIDLLFEFEGKYYVADYKSNYLGNTFDQYHYKAMQLCIESHHYDLQYLLYTWALHKMLENTLVDYDFEKHFGGVYYFFLRGMSPDAPHMSGIYQRSITTKEISVLEQLFRTV